MTDTTAQTGNPLAHSISGELFDQLRHGTSLGPNWGYGGSTETDIEVFNMVLAAIGVRRGFGHSYAMIGSPEAWQAISEYANDRAIMEQTLDGDFDSGMGKRLEKQAAKISARLQS